MVKKSSFADKLLIIIVLLSVLIYTTPIIGTAFRYIVLGLITFILLLTRINTQPVRSNKDMLLVLFLYVFLTASYRLIGLSDNAWGNSMHEYSFFICFILTLPLVNLIEDNQCKWIYILSICIIAFNIADNIALSIIYPQINEYRPDVDESLLKSINAGDSTFYTMSMFFAGVCFFVYLNTKEKFIKYISLLAAMLSAIYIYGYSNKASNVIYLTIFLILLIMARKYKMGKRLLIAVTFFTVFILITINLFRDEIVNAIVLLSPNERLTTRLITIIDPHNMDSNEVTVTGRTNLYLLSIKTWLSNPVNFMFGVGDIRNAANPEATGIGQHSDFIDSLARYGVIGSIFLYLIIIKIFRYIRTLFNHELKTQLAIIFFIFIITGCTKSVLVPNIAVVLFLLLPITSQFVNKPDCKINRKNPQK